MAGANAIYGPGTPLSVSQDRVWRGKDKTNGFLMRNVDGRVPALKESFARADIGAGNVLFTLGAIPYGNALWKDNKTMDSGPGVVLAEKPTHGNLVGIAEFNQGWQTGHPVQNWGVPAYGRADMIRKGYVGYKVAMSDIGQHVNYLKYLQGERTMDTVGTRSFYADWLRALAASSVDGAKLGLFFDHASGFPIIRVVEPTVGSASYTGLKGSITLAFTNNGSAAVTLGANVVAFTSSGSVAYSVTPSASVDVKVGETVNLTLVQASAATDATLPQIGSVVATTSVTEDSSAIATTWGITVVDRVLGVPASGGAADNGVRTYAPGIYGATFAGYVEIFEPENEAVYVAFGL